MAFRDRQWYINAIEREQKNVEQHRADLERHMGMADHSLAAMKCDDLKAALLKLNDLENHLADKGA
ncbi:hypothetical protein WJ96_04335 [Burkholderia ubonensis]|uniref:Uncharacterized protein n=1 Tax=Burkholderia ubonensis TaxID=101571 RepID=A0AAW3MV29_9BURK|nr:hypothetical protein [Burkholderia ubonensis]KVP96457.1 hypothetical protein WJ97_11245 [Burkholderia ubonensis]KVP97803.1 hypothetical protein WJ96_04335 [Burkholderia ubonensis]KVZ92500.1 hypothetical protein WL25_15990 [Burkholderia ubonensis]